MISMISAVIWAGSSLMRTATVDSVEIDWRAWSFVAVELEKSDLKFNSLRPTRAASVQILEK